MFVDATIHGTVADVAPFVHGVARPGAESPVLGHVAGVTTRLRIVGVTMVVGIFSFQIVQPTHIMSSLPLTILRRSLSVVPPQTPVHSFLIAYSRHLRFTGHIMQSARASLILPCSPVTPLPALGPPGLSGGKNRSSPVSSYVPRHIASCCHLRSCHIQFITIKSSMMK